MNKQQNRQTGGARRAGVDHLRASTRHPSGPTGELTDSAGGTGPEPVKSAEPGASAEPKTPASPDEPKGGREVNADGGTAAPSPAYGDGEGPRG